MHAAHRAADPRIPSAEIRSQATASRTRAAASRIRETAADTAAIAPDIAATAADIREVPADTHSNASDIRAKPARNCVIETYMPAIETDSREIAPHVQEIAHDCREMTTGILETDSRGGGIGGHSFEGRQTNSPALTALPKMDSPHARRRSPVRDSYHLSIITGLCGGGEPLQSSSRL